MGGSGFDRFVLGKGLERGKYNVVIGRPSRLPAFQEVTLTEEQADRLRKIMDSPSKLTIVPRDLPTERIIHDESGFPSIVTTDR